MMYLRLCFFIIVGITAVMPAFVFAQASDSFTVRQLYGNDTEPPTIPADVTATPLSTTQIDITWSASTDATSTVAGYQLFRNSVQIATTTLLAYSDTGLTPSTTYSYFVRAFDTFANVSADSAVVSTTTFALPVDPEDPTATSSPSSPQGTVLPPRLVILDIDPGTESARFFFSTVQPVIYTLRYGTTDALSDGFVQADIFKKEHSTILTNLSPLTTYQYELYATDRFGRKVLLKSGSFTTLTRYELPPVPNVSYFTATPSNLNVLLQWGNPNLDSFAYVRVVRNHYYYPQSPTDGIVVYEGTGESFYDEGALSTYERQFYTIFAYNIDGEPSSGAVAVASRQRSIVTDVPIDPGTDETSSTTSDVITEPFRLTFADITIIQNDVLSAATAESVTVDAAVPFMVRIPVELVPGSAKTVIITWQHPFDLDKQTSYLMKRNEEGTHFEAIAAPMTDAGLYPVVLAVFDGNATEIGSVSGVLEVQMSDAAAEPAEPVVYVATMYAIIGGIIGLLSVLGIWWLLLLLMRFLFGDRRDQKEKR